jgi:formamidopyrimidine-DNA glycosylase
MPELPDVQGLKQYIDATSLRQVVCDVSVQDSRIVKDVTVLTLREHLENPERQSTTRHGKYLSASHSSRGNLVLHFRMTENLLYHSYPQDEPEHTLFALISPMEVSSRVSTCDDQEKRASARNESRPYKSTTFKLMPSMLN